MPNPTLASSLLQLHPIIPVLLVLLVRPGCCLGLRGCVHVWSLPSCPAGLTYWWNQRTGETTALGEPRPGPEGRLQHYQRAAPAPLRR